MVPNFIGQTLRGELLTVCDRGQRTRAFCYVDDLVSGIVALVGSNVEGPVNVGSPNELSIVDFDRLVTEVVGSDSEITFIIPDDERTRDDPKRRCPDVTRTGGLLGWTPQVELRDGLEKTSAYSRTKPGLD